MQGGPEQLRLPHNGYSAWHINPAPAHRCFPRHLSPPVPAPQVSSPMVRTASSHFATTSFNSRTSGGDSEEEDERGGRCEPACV